MGSYAKRALVTGASSGLGKAMAERLVAQGHSVVGTGRRVDDGAVANGVILVRMDITDEASVHRSVQEALKRMGGIDVLVNNAGLGIQGPAQDIEPGLAMRLLDTNVLGAHRLCRAVLPGMRAQKSGLIINITSVAANFGLPYRAFYSASKAALERYGEALAIEEERFGITVVNVQPGEFRTPIAEGRLRPERISPEHEPGYARAMRSWAGACTTAVIPTNWRAWPPPRRASLCSGRSRQQPASTACAMSRVPQACTGWCSALSTSSSTSALPGMGKSC